MNESAPAAPKSQPAESGQSASARGVARRFRTPLAIVSLLLLVRIALPYALRPILEDQITKQLVGHIEIGAVELGLLTGRIGVRDVAIFEEPETAWVADPSSPAPAPPPAETGNRTPPEGATPPSPVEEPGVQTNTTPAPEAKKPLIAVGRLAMRIAPFALFDRTVHLREIEIEQPAVDLARLADGKMNVLRVVPERETELAPEPETPEEPWIVAIDRVTLAGGKLVFNDLAVVGAEAIDIVVDRIAVEGVKIGGEPTPDQPARVTLEAHHPDGPLGLEVTAVQLVPVPVLQGHLVLGDFPLRRANVYVPGVGWSGLAGSLDLDLSLDFEPEKRSIVKGTVSVDDVAITVPDLEPPALAWKRLAVAIRELDVVARKARVDTLALTGLEVVVTPGEQPVLPLLRPPSDPGKPALVARASADAPPPAEEAAKPSAPPFDWAVGDAEIDDARVRLRGAHVKPLDLTVKARVREISGAKDAVFPLTLELRDGDSSVVLDGRARMDAPGFGGTLKIDGLDLPRLAAASGQPDLGPAAALRRAMLRSDLVVQAGLGASGDAAGDDLRVSGDLTLSGVEIGDGTKDALRVRLDELGIVAKDVSIPRVLAAGGPAASQDPIHVTLAELRLVKPEVDAVRTVDGIALPKGLTYASEPEETAAASTGTAENEATGAPPAPPPRIEVEQMNVEGGRITLDDRSVTPFFKNGLSHLRVDARGVAWPSRRLQKLDLSASALGRSKWKLSGTGDATGTTLVLDGQKMPLAPLNPYATGAGYSVQSGELTLVSSIWLGAIGFEAKNWVTLHGFDLAEVSTDGRFQKSFGISLPLGIALLKDLNGDIQLTIPVWQDAKGFGVGVAEVVRGALASALLGAVTSPLKLLGSVVTSGDKAEIGAPQPVAFAAAGETLSEDAISRIEAIAQVLSGQPLLVLGLQPVVSPADERRLRELALLAEIEGGGVLGTLRSLPNRSAMTAVRAYLKSGEGTLDEAASAMLEERLAPIVLPADRMQRLASARLDRVMKQLRESHGVPERQLLGRDPVIGEARSAPEVRILFGR